MTATQATILAAVIGSPLLYALFEYTSDKLLAILKYKGWQAVFLESGQVYFGKIDSVNKTEVVLTDIYYLQGDDGDNTGRSIKSSNTSVNLVKLGDEIHGPRDSMIISRAHITFTERLKDTTQVIEAIQQHKLGERIGDKKLKDFI